MLSRPRERARRYQEVSVRPVLAKQGVVGDTEPNHVDARNARVHQPAATARYSRSRSVSAAHTGKLCIDSGSGFTPTL